jgi:hypothetical protein
VIIENELEKLRYIYEEMLVVIESASVWHKDIVALYVVSKRVI